MKPLIGITAGTIYNKEFPYYPFTYGQMHTYAEAVSVGGGTPVILPIGEVKDVLPRLDGVLFAGGNDVSPELYGEKPLHVEKRGVDAPRDEFEVALMKQALAEHVPVLAICRGMQLLNVVRGGTLYQDIGAQVPGAHEHKGRMIKEDFQHLAHELSIVPESKLAEILGTVKIKSNTHHHQAVHAVGKDLTVNAHAEDGIVEGIEDMSRGFVMGVQPHPESLVATGQLQWRPLFAAFVDAARTRATTPR